MLHVIEYDSSNQLFYLSRPYFLYGRGKYSHNEVVLVDLKSSVPFTSFPCVLTPLALHFGVFDLSWYNKSP